MTEDTVFRIGSITKTFTAVAVMQLWEQGLIDLDAAANDYLRAYRLVPAKASWRPATVRHLLTHTAGVPEWLHPSRMVNSGWFGETFALDQPVPTLAEYYRGGLRLAVGAGDDLGVHRPRVRHAGTDRRGRQRRAAGPLLTRAHLPAPRDGDQRPAALQPGTSAACDGLHAQLEGREGT